MLHSMSASLFRAAVRQQLTLPSAVIPQLASTSRLAGPSVAPSFRNRAFFSSSPSRKDNFRESEQSTEPNSSSELPLSDELKQSSTPAQSTFGPSSSAPAPAADPKDTWTQAFADAFRAEDQSRQTRTEKSKEVQQAELEAEWANRPTLGIPPIKPWTSRTVWIDPRTRSVYQSYGHLMNLLKKNNIRKELKLVERYEKPNQMRVRKRRERHRRRFAEMIKEKVKLVLAIKNRGG